MSDAMHANRRSPFDGNVPADRPTQSGDIDVQIEVAMLDSVVLTSTWISGEQVWYSALCDALDGRIPDRVGATGWLGDTLVLRIGPQEMMLISRQPTAAAAQAAAALRQAIHAGIGAVVDLSHARCLIRLQGRHCVDTLAKLYAVDFSASAFAPGSAKLTGHHHVPALLHRVGEDVFDVYVFTTYARDQLETFFDAALEYGVCARAA